jgi:arylsulfatase A-like enzyme
LISAKHAEEGIFVIKGPDIPVQGRVSDASILDVAPTLLYAMRVPVARDMDGRVLTELFEEETLHQMPVEYVESYAHADSLETTGTAGSPGLSDQQRADVRDRLRNLGYLD